MPAIRLVVTSSFVLGASILGACMDIDVEAARQYATTSVDGDADAYANAGPRDLRDCDDADPDIHPNVIERGNGLDDNCNGLVDEPMLDYRSDRPTQIGLFPRVPEFRIRISDAAQLAYLDDGGCPYGGDYFECLDDGRGVDYCKSTVLTCQPASQVKYKLTYVALANASATPTTTDLGVLDIAPNWRRAADPILVVDPNSSIHDLAPLTVYQFQVQLYASDGSTLGPQSDWFYSVTAGTLASPLTPLKWGRVDIVLRAFDELGDFQDGLVGLGGTLKPDGSRYTGDGLPIKWCDDFVRYVGIRVTDGLDGIAANQVEDGGNAFWNTMDPNHVPNAFRDTNYDGCGTWKVDPGVLYPGAKAGSVIDDGCQQYTSLGIVALDTKDNQFFSNQPFDLYYDPIKSLPQNQGVGNFQSMDSHAGIFLAFDPNGDGSSDGAGTIGTVWSIEGNVTNRVKIVSRPSDSTFINGYGKLTEAMFTLP